jgi:hypothetical protein
VASFVNTGADVLQIVYENTSFPVAAWRAERDAGDSQGKNSGELHEVTFAPGKIGQAFQFNGSNSFVNVPGVPAFRFTGPFSLVAWVKYDRITGDYGGTIFMKGPPENPDADWDWGMSISSRKKLRPHVNVNGDWQWFDCKTTLQPGMWYHLAVVFDGTRLKGFVNGKLDGDQGAAGSLRTSDLPIRLGCASPTEPLKTASFLAGQIDEAAVYRGALSAEAIRALYKSQLSH